MRNSKVILIGDVHIGARNGNMVMANHQLRFFEEQVFPYMLKNKIDTILQTGDLFDMRKYTSHVCLHEWHRRFFQIMRMHGFKFHTLLGNHDLALKNTLSVNSSSLLLAQYDNITIYDKAELFEKNGFQMLMVPWICNENEKQILEDLKTTKAQWCMGHFEINNFDMHRGSVCTDGLDKSVFKRFERVLSGHFHVQSDDGHIKYIGTPYPLTWNDYGEQKGFWILDTKTRNLEFVQNKFECFVRIVYNDEGQKEHWKAFDLSNLEGTYTKIVVESKTDLYGFDKLMDKLYQINFAELKIVEDMSEFNSDEIDDENLELSDTKQLIETYIDQAETELNKVKMKSMMKQLYLDALEVTE